MSLSNLEKEIKKTLDNLDKIKMSNKLKAAVIMEAIQSSLDQEVTNEFFDSYFDCHEGNNNVSN